MKPFELFSGKSRRRSDYESCSRIGKANQPFVQNQAAYKLGTRNIFDA